MSITGVQVVSLPVSDQDRARDFYVDVLGFELLRDTQMQPGMRWVQVAPPGGEPTITLVTWFDTMPGGSYRGAGPGAGRPRRRRRALPRGGSGVPRRNPQRAVGQVRHRERPRRQRP